MDITFHKISTYHKSWLALRVPGAWVGKVRSPEHSDITPWLLTLTACILCPLHWEACRWWCQHLLLQPSYRKKKWYNLNHHWLYIPYQLYNHFLINYITPFPYQLYNPSNLAQLLSWPSWAWSYNNNFSLNFASDLMDIIEYEYILGEDHQFLISFRIVLAFLICSSLSFKHFFNDGFKAV